jgi:CubicO group peptidase (beta-lactamase class C family)
LSGLLVLKGGKIELEKYAQGNTENDLWTSMSVVKSYTSVLLGCAIKDGAMAAADLDRPINSYFTDLKGTAYDGVTVRHMLTMTSGVRYNENYSDLTCDVNEHYLKPIAERRPNYIRSHMATLPRDFAPGTQFHYSTGDVFIIGELLVKVTGKSMAEYFSEKIWSRLGAERDGFFLLDSDDGMEVAGSCASFTMRDYGRFGLFILSGGVAGGVQVLPETWIHESTQPLAPNFKDDSGVASGYGYYWWINRDGTFQAVGFQGQMLYINLKEDIVVVMLSALPRDIYRAAGETGDLFLRSAMIAEVVRKLR